MMKVGLIAMGGVWSYDQDHMRFGLSLPGFVERSRVIASLPSLALLTLATHTPEDVKLSYHEVVDLKDADGLPEDFDLVAISSVSARIYEAYALAECLRERGVAVVMGGLHVSALPEEAKSHCTSVAAGEGEILWPRMVEDFRCGQLKEFYTQGCDESFDFHRSRIPRYDLLDVRKYNRLPVQTSRGCPHRCDFCASSVLLTSAYKVKPVENVIQEIRHIKSLWKHPFIEFADDNSFVFQKYSKKLLRALKEEDIRWFTEADISIAEDEELLNLMFESGCRQVLIGLESPNEFGIKGVEQRANWKTKKFPYYKWAIQEIQSRGIPVNGCFILGLDGDTDNVFDQVYEFVKDTGLFDVQITVLTPFPGTSLYKRLKEEGRILEDKAWQKCTLFDVNFIPKQMSKEALEKGMLHLAKKLYDRSFIEERQRRFFKMFRQRKNAFLTDLMKGRN